MGLDKRYRWLTEDGLKFLQKDYLLPGQTVDERVWIIAKQAETILGIEGWATKFVDYMRRGWFSLSTPIWTNFGTDRGLPISCFGSFIEDNMESIMYEVAEMGMMSKYGGGTSAFYGNLRGKGTTITNNGTSSGSVHFMGLGEATVDIVNQGSSRRGSKAVYLPIDHPDIEEFLLIRHKGTPLQKVHPGVTISDQWILEMAGTDALVKMFGEWDVQHRFGKTFYSPDKEKQKVWAKVIESRKETGYPYLVFIDNANNGKPDVYKTLEMPIVASNLCTEIFLPSNAKESFVCDLSSMNVLYFDEWKATDAVQVLTYFLDAVATEFIAKVQNKQFMERARKFAERHRALGIGWIGWHTYLQSKMIPWESMQAKLLNIEVARTIQEQSYAASQQLAVLYGEPKYMKGQGRRNSTLCAIAPTKSSSFILGQVSEGIEPLRSNYFIDDKAKGKFTTKNPILTSLLRDRGMDTPEVWKDILLHRGSVQHLECLSDEEKEVFKTFLEISQKEILIQAVGRQKYIDQGQSLNLMIHPEESTRNINALYLFAWFYGIKSLYYQISVNAAQEHARANTLDCVSCSS